MFGRRRGVLSLLSLIHILWPALLRTQYSFYKLPGTESTVFKLPGTERQFFKLPVTEGTVFKLPGTESTVFKLPGTESKVFKLPGTESRVFHLPGTERDVEMNGERGAAHHVLCQEVVAAGISTLHPPNPNQRLVEFEATLR